jgi:hypothetical protein
MGIPSAAVNEDFVEEDQNKLLKVGLQDFIPENLEGRWGIAKSKRNYQEFIMALMSSESGLRNICFINMNLVIT